MVKYLFIIRKFLIMTLFSLVVSGCSSYGHKLNEDAITQIKKNETTEQQVIDLMGKPMSVGITDDGKKFYMYMYVESKVKPSTLIPIVGAFVGGADTNSETLQIWFDSEGVVTAFAHNNTNSELNTGLVGN
jgi:outer membrane protein assembly factor BamE (lipoprotein component of BamABCDE complex)